MGVKNDIPHGYKQTELGIIPEDWEVVAFKDLGSFSKGSGISRAEANTGRIPCIRYGELYTHHNDYVKSFNSFISQEVASKAKLIKNGDILFAASGETKEDIGKSVAYTNLHEAYAGGDIIIVSTNSFICDAKYIGYASNAPIAAKQKATRGQGDAVVHITTESIKSIAIPLPPLPEQQAIAEALSDVDDLIAALDKKIAKKRLLKQGAMQQLLTGKKRLPGFTDEWVETSIGTGIKFQVGFPFQSQYFTSDKVGKRLVKNRDLKSDDQVVYYVGTYNSVYIVQNGDILIGMDGDFIPCKWNKGVALLNQRVGRLIPYNDWNLTFIMYALIVPLMTLQDGTGATTVKHLSHNDIERMVICMPSCANEQQAIATILSNMDREIDDLEIQREKYRAIKSGMMQKLLMGQVRLKTNY